MVNGQIIASISTLIMKDGGMLRSITPDKDGVYCDVPLMIIGMASRNNAMYEVSSFIDAINNSNSRFRMGLEEGNLEGEWCHMCIGANDESKMAILRRVAYIDRTKVSHYFTKIRVVTTEGGNTIIYGDVVPFGPYAQYLTDSFADPKRNTAFSVRSLTKDIGTQNGIKLKKVVVLKTFDAVDSPGFEAASKRFMLGPTTSNEGCDFFIDETTNVAVSIEDIMQADTMTNLFSMESIDDQQVFDLLSTDQVIIMHKPVGQFLEENGTLLQDSGMQVTPFHAMFGRIANVDSK